MSDKILMCDPPSGWQYGFPKPFTLRDGETLDEWLLRKGYPHDLIMKGFGRYCRFFEVLKAED